MELCIYCNKPMVVATEGRGYKTYRCSKGCPCYRTVQTETTPKENPALIAAKNSSGLEHIPL